jgi:CRP/FNR family cyclic AMP-dependent transcriptional regulator
MVFSNLSPDEMKTIEKFIAIRHYQEGDYVVQEGEKEKSLFVITRGVVQVMKRLDGLNYKELRTLQSGQFFGEISFLGMSERTASIVCVEECEACELTSEAFDLMAIEQAPIAIKILRNVSQGLAVRLKRTTEELKKTLMWAMEGMDL